jgi:hypothetical protein
VRKNNFDLVIEKNNLEVHRLNLLAAIGQREGFRHTNGNLPVYFDAIVNADCENKTGVECFGVLCKTIASL